MDIALTVVSAVVAGLAAVFTWYQARVALHAVRQASLMRLFSTFDLANQATLENTELLYSVHGLDRSVPPGEATNIAYLSQLLDGFQHFYSDKYGGRFEKMAAELRRSSVFLNRILRVPENQVRWAHLRGLYYGDFDKSFVTAIDDLISFERAATQAKPARPSEGPSQPPASPAVPTSGG